MKAKFVITCSTSYSLVLLLVASVVSAQTVKGGCYEVWSPPDKTFAIETPVRLEKKKGEFLDDTSKYKKMKLFGGAIGGKQSFIVALVELSKKGKGLGIKDKFEGLEFLIAGEDASLSTERYLKISGLNAKEITTKFEENGCGKALIIDEGNRIVVLGSLAVESCKDIGSVATKRFFTSFRLLNNEK